MTRPRLSLVPNLLDTATVVGSNGAQSWSEILERDCSPELAVLCRFACELHYAGVELIDLYAALGRVCEHDSEHTPQDDEAREEDFALVAYASVMKIMTPSRASA